MTDSSVREPRTPAFDLDQFRKFLETHAKIDDLDVLRLVMQRERHAGGVLPGIDDESIQRRRELLRRCALPRIFDRALFDVLAADVNESSRAPAFDAIIGHTDVRPVAGTENLYSLRAHARKAMLESWLPESTGRAPQNEWSRSEPVAAESEPPGVRAANAKNAIDWSGAIAALLEARGAFWTPERLYHLVLGNPARALIVLDHEFKHADARFELGTCYRLLEAFEERRPLVESRLSSGLESGSRRTALEALRARVDDLRRYYEIRVESSDDVARSSHTVERAFMRDEWKQLQLRNLATSSPKVSSRAVGPPEPWIVHLEAQGGMGKSMFLRWLGARKCIPARIPYARIDFDFLDTAISYHAPWTLFFQIAERLDAQLPGRPLSIFLDELGQQVDLGRNVAQRRGGLAAGRQFRPELFEKFSYDFTSRLVSALRELNGTPVVLVLDTLEEALLRRNTNLLGVIDAIAPLQHGYPPLQLYLSGRFDLFKKLDGFEQRYGKQTRPLEIRRFSDAEELRFLTKVRGLPHDDAVNAIVERSDGHPMVLALFADEWQLKGRLTREDVLATPAPQLRYLAKRVLERIKDDFVRWMIRYGVVPRRLTREFFEKVVIGELRRAMAGQSSDDVLTRDPELLRGIFNTSALPSVDTPIDVDELWNRLTQYTSKVSFVSSGAADHNVLVFHEDVRHPMRRVLAKQKVFRALHRRAAELAELQAETAVDTDWTTWAARAREVVYHRFQLGRAAASKVWRRYVNLAKAARQPVAAYELATEVTSQDYVDEQGRPLLLTKGRRIIDFQLLFDAHVLRATNAITLGRQSARGDTAEWWRRAGEALDEATRLARRKMIKVNRGALAVLRAQVGARERDPAAAIRALKRSLRNARRPHERQEIASALGHALADAGDSRSVDVLRYAARLAKRATDLNPAVRRSLLLSLAVVASEARRFADAHAALQELIDLSRTEPMLRAWARGIMARNLTQFIHPKEALRIAARYHKSSAALTSLRSSERLQAIWAAATRVIAEANAHSQLGAEMAALNVVEKYLSEFGAQIQQPNADTAVSALGSENRDVTAEQSAEAVEIVQALQEGTATAEAFRGSILSRLLRFSEAIDAQEAGRNWFASPDVGQLSPAAEIVFQKVMLYLDDIGDLTFAKQLLDDAERIPLEESDPSRTLLAVGRARLLRMQGNRKEANALLRLQIRRMRGWTVSGSQLKARKDAPGLRADVRLRLLVEHLAIGSHPLKGAARELERTVRAINPALAARRLLALAVRNTRLSGVSEAAARSILRWCDPASDVKRGCPEVPTADVLVSRIAHARITTALGLSAETGKLLPRLRAQVRKTGSPTFMRALQEIEQSVSVAPPDGPEPAAQIGTDYGEHAPMLVGVVRYNEALRAKKAGHQERAEVLAREAATLMARGSQLVNVWTARLSELRASLATSTEERLAHLAEARNTYHSLGAEADAQRVGVELEEQRHTETRQERFPSLTLRLKGAARSFTAEVHAALPGKQTREIAGAKEPKARRPVSHRPPAAIRQSRALLEALRSDLRQSSALRIPRRAMDLFSEDAASAGAALSELFPLTANLAHATHSGRAQDAVDLRVEVEHMLGDALPFEWMPSPLHDGFLPYDPSIHCFYRSVSLAESQRAHTLWAQRALASLGAPIFADGIAGPATRQALSQFQQTRGLPESGVADGPTSSALVEATHSAPARAAKGGAAGVPNVGKVAVTGPRVLILGESTSAQHARSGRRARRAFVAEGLDERDAGERLQQQYRRLGFETSLLRPTSPLELTGVCRDIEPEVLHVIAPYSEYTASGGIVADFAGRERGAKLSAAIIAKAVAQHEVSQRPIIVLDVPRISGRSEAVRQLFLRNAFGAELFTLRSAVAVVGIGLLELSYHATVVNAIMSRLGNGEPLSMAVSHLRRAQRRVQDGRGGGSGSDTSVLQPHFAMASIAVWAYDPALVYLPRVKTSP